MKADQTNPSVDLEWEQAIENCSYATFFHTRAWARILVAGFGRLFHPSPKIIPLGQGKRGILPLMETEYQGKGFFRALHAGALGVYGGPLLPDGGAPRVVKEILSGLHSAQTSNVFIFGNPYAPSEFQNLWEDPRRVVQFTQIVDFQGMRDENDLFSIYSKSVRKRIRAVPETRYVVRPAASIEDVRSVERIYRERLAQWGDRATNSHPLSLFEAIYNLGGEAARIWIVESGGEIVAGNVNFYFRNTCVDWLHICNKDHLPMGLSHYFTHWLVRDAWSRGYSVYDFNPSGGHEGVVAFKRSFGAVEKPFSGYSWGGSYLYQMFNKMSFLRTRYLASAIPYVGEDLGVFQLLTMG